MPSSRTLTQEEQAFAEKSHNLIYTYLQKRNLSIDAFYDIVVFGFLRAVKKYNDRPDLRKYSFPTIAWSCMDTEYSNYCKSRERLKNCANVGALSLNAPLSENDDRELGETIITADTTSNHIEYIDLWCQITPKLSTGQKHVLCMLLDGYSEKEIADKCHVDISTIEFAISRIRERSREYA